MVQDSQTVLQLPTKTTVAATDKIMIVANAAGAGNVAMIMVGNLFGNSSIQIRYGNSSVNSTLNATSISFNGNVGVSGTFTAGSNTVTVTKGIITSIT